MMDLAEAHPSLQPGKVREVGLFDAMEGLLPNLGDVMVRSALAPQAMIILLAVQSFVGADGHGVGYIPHFLVVVVVVGVVVCVCFICGLGDGWVCLCLLAQWVQHVGGGWVG